MKKILMASLVIAGTSWWVGDLTAHGGTYRGPGDTVPPGAGGGGGGAGPTTGGTGAPAGPGNAAPTTGGPATPNGPGNAGGNGPTTGGAIGVDLTMWSFWWEFNKDPFLNLREAIYAGGPETGEIGFFTGKGSAKDAKDIKRPSPEKIYGDVVPALIATLESETNNDIVTGCMIALAKIGDEQTGEGGESEFEQIIRPFLKSARQEVRETAALSLGILANKASIPLLAALINDTDEGRKAVGSTEVDLRTRAFSAYGLGLIGYQEPDNAVRQEIVKLLVEALPSAEKAAAPDIAVGLVTSLGLTKLDIGGERAPADEDEEIPAWDSREAQVQFLLDTFEDDSRNRFFRAHLPVAAARLLGGLEGKPGFDEMKQQITDALLLPLDKRKGGKYEVELRQSSALTLGLIGDADLDDVDKQIRKALVEIQDADRQVIKYALIALAKSTARKGDSEEDPWGGRDEAVKHMLGRMAKGKSGEERWAAMAIGVYGHYLAKASEDPPASLAEALRDRLSKAKSTDDIAAYSVANGIFKNNEAKEELRERLQETKEPTARGYVALALGMVSDERSEEDIQEIVRESEYVPDLLKQAAIALGLLGDKSIVEDLTDMLKEANSLATQASLAQALGFIGDDRSIEPLVDMLGDSNLTDTARGFAAVALGIVADKEYLPWNSKVAVDVNYRASTETLNTMDGKGLLNIL